MARTFATRRWRRPASVLDSGRSEVRDRIAASAEPKLSPDLLISPEQPLPPPLLPREQKEVVEQEAPPDSGPATRAGSVRLRPQPRRARPSFAAPAAPARRLPGRRRPGPARPRVRRCRRAGAPGRPGRCAVFRPGRRPPGG